MATVDQQLDNEEEEFQEKQHFQRIVNAFRYYRIHGLKRVLTAEKYYTELPEHHKERIPHFRNNLRKLRKCIEANFEVIKLIIANTDHMFLNKDHGPVNDTPTHQATEFDMDKVKTTLKQFVRDWSADGQAERDTCYKPVIEEIQARFKDECPQDVSVLVPGAGLGRLAYEIARLGFRCQGNEFSLFMLFASNFILNKCCETNMFALYPWVHQFCNNLTFEDQTHAIHFPDLNPADLPEHADFSMAAGDFLEVYTEAESWDCVATVYFIDTAHNIISYIESIYHILKPGGYWINNGPLLYHFAEMASESSIELPYSDVREVIKSFNFEILHEDLAKPSTYTQNPRSMLKYEYNCVFLVCRKPLEPSR